MPRAATGGTHTYVFSAMVGMARCAVPARVVAGGTHVRAIPAFEAVAPLHAARTSQRDVPTTLTRYKSLGYFRSSLRDDRPGAPALPRAQRTGSIPPKTARGLGLLWNSL